MTAITPVADVAALPCSVRHSGPAVGTCRAAPSYMPAVEDVLLAGRLVQHPMIAASIITVMREALAGIDMPAIALETFALRTIALGAAEAIARDDVEGAQRLLAWCRH